MAQHLTGSDRDWDRDKQPLAVGDWRQTGEMDEGLATCDTGWWRSSRTQWLGQTPCQMMSGLPKLEQGPAGQGTVDPWAAHWPLLQGSQQAAELTV